VKNSLILTPEYIHLCLEEYVQNPHPRGGDAAQIPLQKNYLWMLKQITLKRSSQVKKIELSTQQPGK